MKQRRREGVPGSLSGRRSWDEEEEEEEIPPVPPGCREMKDGETKGRGGLV